MVLLDWRARCLVGALFFSCAGSSFGLVDRPANDLVGRLVCVCFLEFELACSIVHRLFLGFDVGSLFFFCSSAGRL